MISESVDDERPQIQKRLIIDHIVLENFKSYAGRQLIGPFHQNFTSIVGPNGSGKSNVIDAFMFVLGYRAKKLRQGRLSELIHNSDGMLNVESCTVEVHFKLISSEDSSGDELLCVSRTAYRNNSNKYQINGNVSNYAEVTTLLKNFGVDLDHKRFLILQGEVESIAQMKPKAATEHEEGLLEYLEDIIGTNKYIEKIEESGKAVDLANDVCAEKVVRVKAAEREVLALTDEKNEAEAFIVKENNLTIKKAELYQLISYQSAKQIEKLSQKLEKVKEDLSNEQAKNTEKCGEIEAMEAELKDLLNKHVKQEAQIAASLKKISNLEKEDIKLQETKKHLKTKIQNLTRSLADESKNRSNISKEIADNEQELGVIKEALEKLNRELEKEEAELAVASESLKGKTGEFQSKLEKLQKELAPWTEKICQEQDAYEGAVLALKSFEKKQKSGLVELSETEKQLKGVENELNEAQKTQKSLLNQKEQFASEIKRVEEEIAAGEEISAGLNGSIGTIQATIAEANEALRQGNSGSAALAALMRESSAGRIKGVHGRLGDLGIIDSKYDCAITTACSSLNFIVVDDTQSGQKCVEFLRKNNLGRASFIILEKMRNPDLKPNYLPSGAQRLFDLVNVKDKKFLPAFYYALNDTLVAQNMEEASKLAYNGPRRFRAVTLDGKLIDTSGTMSGGGSNKQFGGMKASFVPEVSREQLAELNAILSEKLNEQKAVKAGLMRFQEMLSKARIDAKKCEMELGKLEIALKSLPQQIADLEESIEMIKARDLKPNREEIERMNSLQAQVIQHESNLQELKASCGPIHEAIEECQNQILEAGGTRFKAQRSKVNDLKDQIKLQEKRAAKLSTQNASLTKQLESGQVGIIGNSELEALEAELKVIEASVEELTKEAFQVQQGQEGLSRELEGLKEQIGEKKKDLEAISRELTKFRKREFEMKSTIEALEKEIDEFSVKKAESIARFKKLSIHEIEIEGEGGLVKPEIPVYESDQDFKDLERGRAFLEQSISVLEAEIAEMRPNLKILAEYREKALILRSLKDELAGLEAKRDEQRDQLETLKKMRHDEFMQGFRQISLRLKELYQLITMGGNAELELVDSLDPFNEGILFSVMPPKKSWKNISDLSGGEKTLSSLALVFALHTFKPTPIYVMDEIDAALDFRNVSIVANYLKERTRDAQFIVISLRNNMFELADRLVGIYKTNQRTKSVTIDPNSFSIKT